jgi:flagellar hook-basal body complex protein FliE
MDIQRLNALLSMQPTPARTEEPQVDPSSPTFSQVLENAMQQVEQDQKVANDMAVKLATGEIDDIAQVMIASERASLSLNLAIQVRNKVIEAYQEIMRMPL